MSLVPPMQRRDYFNQKRLKLAEAQRDLARQERDEARRRLNALLDAPLIRRLWMAWKRIA